MREAAPRLISLWGRPRARLTPKIYDHTAYGDAMFHFQTRTRTTHYPHAVVGAPGLDHCFDCASEVQILAAYLRANQRIRDAWEAKNVERIDDCSSSSSSSSSHENDQEFKAGEEEEEMSVELCAEVALFSAQISAEISHNNRTLELHAHEDEQ